MGVTRVATVEELEKLVRELQTQIAVMSAQIQELRSRAILGQKVDNIASSIAGLHRAIDQQFVGLHARLDRTDGQLSTAILVTQEFASIARDTRTSLGAVEHKVDGLTHDMASLSDKIDSLTPRH